MNITRRQAIQTTALACVAPKALWSATRVEGVQPEITSEHKEEKVFQLVMVSATFEVESWFVMDQTKYMEVFVGKYNDPEGYPGIDKIVSTAKSFRKALRSSRSCMIVDYNTIKVVVDSVEGTPYFGGRVIVRPYSPVSPPAALATRGLHFPHVWPERQVQFDIYNPSAGLMIR